MKTLHFFKSNLQGSFTGPAFTVDEADIGGAVVYMTNHATVEFVCDNAQGAHSSVFVNVVEDVDTVLA